MRTRPLAARCVPCCKSVCAENHAAYAARPGTSRTDRIEKLREYQATESIQRYVILEQDSVAATVFARHGADWDARALTADDVLRMPEIDVELRLADIYADLQFEADDAGGADPGALNAR